MTVVYIKAEQEVYSMMTKKISEMVERNAFECICKTYTPQDTIEEKSLLIYEASSALFKSQCIVDNGWTKKQDILFITKDKLLSQEGCLYKHQTLRCFDVEKDIDSIIEQVKKFIILSNSFIKYTSGFMNFEINPEHILYIESYHHDLYIHTKLVKLRIRDSLKNYIIDNEFVHLLQIHKSFVINLQYVKEIKRDTILMKSEEVIPIGNRYKEALNIFLKNNMK